MAKKRKKYTKKQAQFWAYIIVLVLGWFMQQNGKPVNEQAQMPTQAALQDVSVASVYDGDTFKINLNCVLTKSGRYNEKKSDDDIADSILLYASNFDKYCNKKRGNFGGKGDK